VTNPFDGHALPSPVVADEAATDALASLFGVTGRLTSLGSHQDLNWRVDADVGQFVLKVSNPGFPRSGLAAQNAAMRHLAAASDLSRHGVLVPVPQPSVHGQDIATWHYDGQDLAVRLVTYLPGRPLADFDYLAPSVLRAQGRLAAVAAAAFGDFDHPGIDRVLQWDSRYAFVVIDALRHHVVDDDERRRIDDVAQVARVGLESSVDDLRLAVVHADVTDVNVVAQVDRAGRPQPRGLIDFGDMARTWIASDVATAVVGVTMHDLDHPLHVAREVLCGYHEVLPLTAAEVDAVWPLVLARAAVCQVSSEQQVQLDPHSEYARTSLAMDRANLRAVADVPLPLAAEVLRAAVGLPAGHVAPTRVGWVAPVAAASGYDVLDLSTTSLAVDARAVVAGSGDGLGDALSEAKARSNALVVTPHGRPRFTDTKVRAHDEAPLIQLGRDFYAAPGATVVAPTAGSVASAAPLVLAVDGWWLTLTGVDASVVPGQAVPAGGVVGEVAAAVLPHVNVQLAPAGVHAPPAGLASLATGWLRLCPDPLPAVAPIPAPTDDAELHERRQRVLAGVQGQYYEQPPRIERGWGEHLFDIDGRAYVDMVNNVAVLGHSHPVLADAVGRQLQLLNTNSRFHYEVVVEFAERLAATLPAELDTVFCVSTGSEANDLAMRLAMAATGHDHFIAVQSGYHGWTYAADAVTTSLADNPQAVGTRPSWVHTVASPNTYRGLHRGPDAGPKYAADVRRCVDEITAAGNGVAAFIAEPLYGNAGGILLPDGYLTQAYAAVRSAGGLCIADEVQVGYARTGHWFWAFEQQGVVPDIVTVAKAAGNGVAVGAVITRRELADAFGAQGSFFSSVGGSPVSAAAGLAVLDVIAVERLQDNARTVGDHLVQRLRDLASRHAIIGAVHGSGLYLGVELVRDHTSLEPATEEAWAICERMRELGVVVQPTSDDYNVLKIKPPMCITRDSADFFVDTLDRVLSTGW
jgi:4-aminobutyrate aminotransferase-like enzyme/Ser/Thr protein kinase RdoA (MazF antagonist)